MSNKSNVVSTTLRLQS